MASCIISRRVRGLFWPWSSYQRGGPLFTLNNTSRNRCLDRVSRQIYLSSYTCYKNGDNIFVWISNIFTPTLLLVSWIISEMEASEIEFMAEKEKIEIIPNFAHAAMHLIQARSPDVYFLNLLNQGEVGPFKPGISLSCPLWLAVNLKQRQRCRIVCPAWMEVCPSIEEQISQHHSARWRG